jgi:lysozyme
MTASAQGIDVSSFQAPLTAADLDGLDFAFAKATDGQGGTDQNFAANWRVMKSEGKHRGTYHELWSASSAPVAGQAAHFLATVGAQGIEPGDMLAVVASDYSGVTDAEVKAFCDTVKAAEPRCPVLVYSDLSVAGTLVSCTGYELWSAWPSPTAPASVKPWKNWRFWQWGESGVDRNAYNGTAAELQAWLNSIAYPAPAKPPAPATFGPPRNLTVRAGDSTVLVERCDPPAGASVPPDHYEISVYTGSYPSATTQVLSYPRYMKAAPEQFGGLAGIPSGEHMTLRAIAYTAGGQASAYADVSFEMP